MRRSVAFIFALAGVTAAVVLAPTPLPAQEPSDAETDAQRPPSRGVRTRLGELVRGSDKEAGALERESGARTATLRKGWIPVVELLRFIEDSTGRPVVYPSALLDPHFGAEAAIHFLADQEGFNVETARFYLERNGYELAAEEIAPGRSAIVVTARMARMPVSRGVLSAELVIGPEEPIPAAAPGSRAMVACSLRNADSGSVAQALREILAITGAGAMQVVAVPGAPQVTVVAPIESLRAIREMVALLDVDIDLPPPQPGASPAVAPESAKPRAGGR